MEIILCRTQSKQSYTVDEMFFHFEYAVESIDVWEKRDEIAQKWGMREVYNYENPWMGKRRKVTFHPATNETFYADWDFYGVGKDETDAILQAASSDFYYETTLGLHPLHKQIVDRQNLIAKLREELNDLEDQIIPNKFMRNSKLYEKYEQMVFDGLKAKKLYSKYKKDWKSVDPVVLDSIRLPIKDLYLAEKETIENRITEIKEQLSEFSN